MFHEARSLSSQGRYDHFDTLPSDIYAADSVGTRNKATYTFYRFKA